LKRWQRDIVVLPADKQTATTWGRLQAGAQRRGRPRPVNDTWIAACCIVEGIPLATFNTKDYADFAEYDGLDLFDVS
jgi:toxin FitB